MNLKCYCCLFTKLYLTLCNSSKGSRQHARFLCRPLSPGTCSNLCPLRWCSLKPSHPLPPPSPFSSLFPSIRVFSNELALCIRWPKYWNFSISPSNEYSGLSSFRIDWLDLLAAQGTLRSLLLRHSLKASVLWRSAFFTLLMGFSRQECCGGLPFPSPVDHVCQHAIPGLTLTTLLGGRCRSESCFSRWGNWS